MDRRKFFGLLIGGMAAGAAMRSWPFRVYSFPSELEIARTELLTAPAEDYFHWSKEMNLPVIYVPSENPAAIVFEKAMREHYAMGETFSVRSVHVVNPKTRMLDSP